MRMRSLQTRDLSFEDSFPLFPLIIHLILLNMSKILVLHPDSEHLETIIAKVNTLNSKSGPFNAVILLGDVLNGITDISCISKLDTSAYFTEGPTKLKNDDQLETLQEKNLTYLKGHYGVFTTADDVKIAYITGDDSFIKANVTSILETFTKQAEEGIDILISSKWTNAIANEEKIFYGDSQLDPIVEVLKPRYHFCIGSKSGKFFERAPFQWKGTDDHTTRFISLAKFGGKEKWIYAFNLNKETVALPANLTPNPFEMAKEEELKKAKELALKRKSPEDETKGMESESYPLVKKHKREVLPENCFFCLSNPKLQHHMIISIGEHAYLTIAKGPLTKPTGPLRFSGHCLIIPIGHIPNLPHSEEGSVIKTPVYNEILRFQVNLVKLFAKFDMGTIFFQINKKDQVHYHIQTIPIVVDFLADFEKVLKKNVDINNKSKYKTNSKFNFKKFTSSEDQEYLEIINDKETDYISFTVFNKSVKNQEIYISVLEKDSSLDLQFGRKVLAFLLQTPKRVKWINCEQTTKREEEETELFKGNFKEFDFTLDL